MDITRRDWIAGAAASTLTVALPVRAQGGGTAPDKAAEAALSKIADAMLLDSPETASSLGIDTGARAALKSRLGDRSAAGQRRVADHLRAHVATLKRIDTAPLSPATRTDIDVVKTAFETALDGFALPYGDVAVGGWRNTPYVVIQNVGAYLDVPRFLDSDHSISERTDAEAYLARLDSYARQLDDETQRVRAASARGVVPPDFLLDKTIRQLEQSVSGDPAGWDIVTSLGRRTRDIPGDWTASATAVARDRVKPALERQLAAIRADRARATSDAGMWARPDGDAWYAWGLRASTTTTMTPDEVHARGKEELAALQGQMDVILKSLGLTKGSVGERMTALGKDPRYTFPNDDAGRAQIMALVQNRLTDIRARMPRAFNTLAPGNVEVRRIPVVEEAGAPGAYGGPGSIDGKVPGKMWINLRTTELWTRYSLPTLVYHEAIPGHVWQGEYTFRLPLIRSLLQFNAFSEGWALYSEQLGDELGAYDGDPVGRLGYLQSIAFRACRMVVDTGLHAKRWTREQAVQWFASTNGSSVEEVSGEVDRYCSWPGQACGYKVGHSEINRLRDRAKTALGPRYDFKAFNDAVVQGGGVPMTVLGRNIDAFVAGRNA
ncbi:MULTISPECIES: DUF885 domain-containing protein [unclassified Sphingomonas]|uniref:DUF885 domain-containing protein n=1 Tax=unclassified Sphingomonas TaxID=196159 RepID=UPI0006F74667|nr:MULTISPECIES: DUF885 domain-containing protein [unclassified Sphingomonas]KQM66998.1 twin-arginine translocation pathway signal [Sphingomonas sp. Leaf16]KQN17944.1 twin-arginine translocation pathway signal [Sphingomonas sp. Leaf29]KQN23808.1 twin-arginine translocation pathway signal [Sphingomonas sp. Leaf32]